MNFKSKNAAIQLYQDQTFMNNNFLIQKKISNIPDNLGEKNQQYLKDLAGELRRLHPLFQQISEQACQFLLQSTKILIYEKSHIYFEKDMDTPYSFVILYGSVYLRTEQNGVIMKCLMGETLAEENLIGNRFFPR